MVPPGVKAIIFDAVDTLIHPNPPAVDVYFEVGRRFGSHLPPPAIRANFIAAFSRQDALDYAKGLITSEARETERGRSIVAESLVDVPDPSAPFHELFSHFSRSTSWWCDPESITVLSELFRRGYLL